MLSTLSVAEAVQSRYDTVSFMASTTFLMEAAKRSLHEEGFLDLDDSGVGDLVLEMEKRNFQYLSAFGLDYCEQYVLGEPVSITEIIMVTI